MARLRRDFNESSRQGSVKAGQTTQEGQGAKEGLWREMVMKSELRKAGATQHSSRKTSSMTSGRPAADTCSAGPPNSRSNLTAQPISLTPDFGNQMCATSTGARRCPYPGNQEEWDGAAPIARVTAGPFCTSLRRPREQVFYHLNYKRYWQRGPPEFYESAFRSVQWINPAVADYTRIRSTAGAFSVDSSPASEKVGCKDTSVYHMSQGQDSLKGDYIGITYGPC